MRVNAELSGRRLALALLLLAILPGLAIATGVSYRRPDLPPGPGAYDPLPLPRVPLLEALYVHERSRSRQLAAIAPQLPAPQLVPATFPDPLPTLVLPPRTTPYPLEELQRTVPEAFESIGGAVLVRAPIEVPTGATLTIDSAATPDVRLLSSPDGFAPVIAEGGNIEVRGTTEVPARISSWDAAAGHRDEVRDDGRAFLLEVGGRMDLAHADISYLGFGTGSSSGIAWRGADHPAGTPRLPATGDVFDSVLHHNWFGTYTFEADSMRWQGNTFEDNDAYGFDPHDVSNNFVVVHNVARGNGRHGFIFSRGCDNNVLSHNVAYDNRGHGFMIDDGHSEDPTRVLPSNGNQLLENVAHDNDGSGVEIEGGTGTVVVNNVLERNHVGVRVKDDGAAAVKQNRVAQSRLAGVNVLNSTAEVRIVGNDVSGGWAGVLLARAVRAHLQGNQLADASAPVVENGRAIRSESVVTFLGQTFRWKPFLALWTVILGCPTLLASRRVVRALLRPRRTSLRVA
jgi:parallel beta-helix repeat protein